MSMEAQAWIGKKCQSKSENTNAKCCRRETIHDKIWYYVRTKLYMVLFDNNTLLIKLTWFKEYKWGSWDCVPHINCFRNVKTWCIDAEQDTEVHGDRWWDAVTTKVCPGLKTPTKIISNIPAPLWPRRMVIGHLLVLHVWILIMSLKTYTQRDRKLEMMSLTYQPDVNQKNGDWPPTFAYFNI